MLPSSSGLIDAAPAIEAYGWAKKQERSEFAAYISAPPLPLQTIFQGYGPRRFRFKLTFISHFFFPQP
jgi:hypothetical protein